MRSTIKEETLSVKIAFKIFSNIFGFKMNRYHAYNVIFSEQPLRTAIEDSNQKINFCGVVYHHKYSIFERKTQTIKLIDIKLLLRANIYSGQRQ